MRSVLRVTAGVRAMTPSIRSLLIWVTHGPCRQGDLRMLARGDFCDLRGCTTGRQMKMRKFPMVNSLIWSRCTGNHRENEVSACFDYLSACASFTPEVFTRIRIGNCSPSYCPNPGTSTPHLYKLRLLPFTHVRKEGLRPND